MINGNIANYEDLFTFARRAAVKRIKNGERIEQTRFYLIQELTDYMYANDEKPIIYPKCGGEILFRCGQKILVHIELGMKKRVEKVILSKPEYEHIVMSLGKRQAVKQRAILKGFRHVFDLENVTHIAPYWISSLQRRASFRNCNLSKCPRP